MALLILTDGNSPYTVAPAHLERIGDLPDGEAEEADRRSKIQGRTRFLMSISVKRSPVTRFPVS
jgi:hypothetical protein